LPFNCIHCHKTFTTQHRLDTHLHICKSKPIHNTCSLCKEQYMIGKEEEHKVVCTYKPVDELPKQKPKLKKQYQCVCCHKCVASQQNLTYHLAICKEKKALDLSQMKRDKTQQRQLELTVRDIKETMEDQIEQLTFEIRNTKEELEHELRIKDEKIKQLEQSQLVVHNGKTSHTNITTYENVTNSTINQAETMNNYTTIFQYITPQVIKEAYQDYTIEQIKGGQKEFADVVRKSLINQHGQAGYICKDRSRKKCGYINESHEFVEDIQCNKLIQTSLPALPYIMESYKSSSGDDKYMADQSQIKKGIDDIINIDKDSTVFVNHISKLLPSNPHQDNQHVVNTISSTLQEVREELDDFVEEERQFKIEQEEDMERERQYGYTEPVARTIGGIRLGALDIYYKRYQRDGTFIIKPELQTLYNENETLRKEYDDLIKNGLYYGNVIWSV
jgi:hypothetical protein